MRREVAERLAATAVDELRVEHAHAVIGAFLTELAGCQVCAGSGEFTFPRAMELELRDRRGQPVSAGISQGTLRGGGSDRPVCWMWW